MTVRDGPRAGRKRREQEGEILKMFETTITLLVLSQNSCLLNEDV